MIADGLDKSRFALENCCLNVIVVDKKPVETGSGLILVCQPTSCLSLYDLVVKVESNDGKKKEKQNKALYLNFKVFIWKILTGNTILRDHPRATRRSTRLRGEESTFFSQLL